LKRERGGVTWYNHIQLVVSLVFPGNIRLPLYVYPIHAKSLGYEKTVADDKFKQECELSAFPLVLKKIRERFPKLSLCVLLDSLYANGPVIKLLRELGMEFMIVRKAGSMKTVGEDCNGLEKVDNYKTNNQIEENSVEDGRQVKRLFRIFNEIGYHDLKINILRFDERVFDKDGVIIFYVHWEWIVSWKLTKKNAFSTAFRGRMRWLEEDLFNSVKNRGFNIKHDYSRNSVVQNIWSCLIMIAFFISELFALTKRVAPIKKTRSLKDFMHSIFHDLTKLCEAVFQAPVLKMTVQFRYCLDKARFKL
jgi:hypothetical protein